ncbi:hypothetical protein AB833_11960 [Chromatiales bacterium (ex Bugula neritina AB1)]|nr:hypothetical protein AB833_11960 [Chromatiales bacterium (ex Bugula neritina AB1)]
MFTLEVCVDSVAGLQACIEGGADRIELCSALPLGGLTPSEGMMRLAAGCPLPVSAMVRPRDGDFYFSETEIELMCDDIHTVAHTGIDGVVLGAANTDNTLNCTALEKMAAAADGLSKTLHRVIDTLENPLPALEQAIELGFERILTSGGAPGVGEGTEQLTQLHRAARGRIEIIAGAGLAPELLQAIADCGIRSFHSSCSSIRPMDQRLVSLGFSSARHPETDVNLIKTYKSRFNTITLQE